MTISKPRGVGEKDTAIGERIRTQRMAIGMSQEELASRLGLSFQQIQKFEKGVNRISAVRLSEIANALQANAVTILDGVTMTVSPKARRFPDSSQQKSAST